MSELPQSAEVFLAWRGRQVNRWHSFSNYPLFAIDDKERFDNPKNVHPTASTDPAGAAPAQTKTETTRLRYAARGSELQLRHSQSRSLLGFSP